MITTAVQTNQPILLPQYGFPGGRDPQPVPGYHADRFTAGYLLQILGTDRDRISYYTLREPATPRPEGAFNVVVITGGRHRYHRSVDHTNRRPPWWYRAATGMRDSYAVWGRHGKEGFRVFDPDRPARTSSGRGAIYTRWPVYNQYGQLTEYGWEVAHVEFTIHNRYAERGDKLKLTVDRRRGRAELGHAKDHDDLLGWREDELWNELDRRAKAGFDAHCTDRLDEPTDRWLTWFLKQKALGGSTTQADRFHHSCARMGWSQALDHVTEAWELAIALSTWSHLFPEVVPNLDLPADPRLVDRPGYIGPIPYEGTTGGMEARMLEAYLNVRPERRDTLEEWMTDYVHLVSSLRNYTGD